MRKEAIQRHLRNRNKTKGEMSTNPPSDSEGPCLATNPAKRMQRRGREAEEDGKQEEDVPMSAETGSGNASEFERTNN